jgi:hypothetical protein
MENSITGETELARKVLAVQDADGTGQLAREPQTVDCHASLAMTLACAL